MRIARSGYWKRRDDSAKCYGRRPSTFFSLILFNLATSGGVSLTNLGFRAVYDREAREQHCLQLISAFLVGQRERGEVSPELEVPRLGIYSVLVKALEQRVCTLAHVVRMLVPVKNVNALPFKKVKLRSQ